MDFNLKNYRVIKVKNYIKKCDFFFFFHSAKLKSTEWIHVEQNFKKLKLKQYKVFNGTTVKTINNSIYKNFTNTVCGVVLFIAPTFKTTLFEFNSIKKDLKSFFALFTIKLNNKFYATDQLNGIKTFSYNQNMFSFYKSLNRYLKLSHKLTK